MMKRTPLYEKHILLGGKIIDFGGWELPVQYSSIIEEHNTVRSIAGLFDVSHMGEILVEGANASQFIQKLITNDVISATNNQVIYTPMCYPDGGVVDDLLVYKFNEHKFLLVVNAANIDKDYEWIKENTIEDVNIENLSHDYVQLAIQGPKAEKILQKLTDYDLSSIKFFTFREGVNLKGYRGIVSRTGYTGEDGFEIYVKESDAPLLWDMILEAGKEEGILPAGLGARDTLRFEAALPLYGHEISQDINPLEARLGIFVKLNKENFIGKEALTKQKEQGILRKIVGLEMIERGIPRHGYKVLIAGEKIGFITSGNFSPSLNKNFGMALIENEHAIEGNTVDVLIRNKFVKARIIKLPFYKKKYKV